MEVHWTVRQRYSVWHFWFEGKCNEVLHRQTGEEHLWKAGIYGPPNRMLITSMGSPLGSKNLMHRKHPNKREW